MNKYFIKFSKSYFSSKSNNSFIFKNSTYNYLRNNKTKFEYKFPKRRFNNFFQGGNSTFPPALKLVFIINTIIFGLGFFMNKNDYLKQFLYSHNSFKHGKVLSLVTAHFTKVNWLEFILDNIIIIMLGMLVSMNTPDEMLLQRLILYSIGIGSTLLILFHKDEYFVKSDAILRGIIMYFVFSQPNHSFLVIPFPFRVKAMHIGLILVFFDLVSQKYCNFGGTIASFILTKRF